MLSSWVVETDDGIRCFIYLILVRPLRKNTMVNCNKLSVVIPVYNEAENIKKTLHNLITHAALIQEVIIVYDLDNDTTVPVVQAIKHEYIFPLCLVKNMYGRGALNAIKTGFVSAHGDAIVVVMADMADDLRILPYMYKEHIKGVDIVCGSRYMPGGKQIGGPFLKGLMSRVAGLSLYYLTPLSTRDITNSFKLYRTSLLRSIRIESTGGFELGMEITIKAFLQGAVITEIPSIWTDRTAGESRFKLWSWLPHYLYWYFLVLVKRGPLFRIHQGLKCIWNSVLGRVISI